jgi:hypothetical protein
MGLKIRLLISRTRTFPWGLELRAYGGICRCAFCAHKVFQRLWGVDLRAKQRLRGYGWAVACEGSCILQDQQDGLPGK